MQTLSASVVITTKNRKEELRNAITSALAQMISLEVLVIDDGSTDGTAEMVRAEFPTVRLERSETSFGLIVQRNRAARLAGGDIIFSIDDDAVFVSRHTVAQTLQEFDRPRVGAVAIPYLEPRKSPLVHQRAPAPEGLFITDDFIGTAHAVRKDLFLQLGGYREYLVHQGEEMDFCIRMLAAGRVVRLGRADVLHHLESPRRDFRRMDYYGRRNDIIFAWLNVPQPSLIFFLPMLVLNATIYSLKTKGTLTKLRGIGAGLMGIWHYRKQRAPVSRKAFKLFRWLRKRGPARLADIESQLPLSTN